MSERIANILGSGLPAATAFSLPAARFAALAALLSAAMLATGCGQKGPLYLPPAGKPATDHTHVPAASPALPASSPASTPTSRP